MALTAGSTSPAMLKEMRAPLGIYNVSTHRVLGKVERLAHQLEVLFSSPDLLEQGNSGLAAPVVAAIDYMELAVYAAAEHVDDVAVIAEAYLPNKALRGKNSHFRKLENEIKQHKRLLSKLANSIKHAHSRLRMFAADFWHDGRYVPLYGYFVEGAKGGVLGPTGLFHAEHKVFSASALPWEILEFIVATSRSLRDFIEKVRDVPVGPHACTSDALSRAIVAAARLPLYAFNEPHPFDRSTISIAWGEGQLVAPLDSGLYGSFESGWSLSTEHRTGRTKLAYEGDGVTRSFALVHPTKVRFLWWR
ncbi:MAG: hypothetical protein Q8M77_06955 [Hydrogenophaga sp.]|nr:hypothetical protein [Hydrogenophaga sp.]